MRKNTEQGATAEFASMRAERDALVERKKAAWWSRDSAEYMRCLDRIAEIETRLTDGIT